MPIAIGDFEVVPETTPTESSKANTTPDGKSTETPEMKDHEVKRMLERRAERLERVSAH